MNVLMIVGELVEKWEEGGDKTPWIRGRLGTVNSGMRGFKIKRGLIFLGGGLMVWGLGLGKGFGWIRLWLVWVYNITRVHLVY